jgi:endonuclease/exonuclease/phosphatase family metal-dependent hydrolase
MMQLYEVARIPAADKLLPTWPSGTPSAKIDYILFSANHSWQVDAVEVLPEAFLSNHRPILASFRW